jgi:hypothetical protein
LLGKKSVVRDEDWGRRRWRHDVRRRSKGDVTGESGEVERVREEGEIIDERGRG